MYLKKEKRDNFDSWGRNMYWKSKTVMLNFSGTWGGSFWEPDQENVDVEGGEDGDGEGQEQGEDKGDPSVPVRTFAQAVLQSFWGGRGEVAETIGVG